MSLLVSLPTLACVAMTVIEVGSENIVASLICGALSGPLAVAIFMVLLPVFEMTFRRVSYFKYYELTAHKSKLIKKLIQQAPGTFNHSIVVSNIAEACASAIDEDALLARTCAYYHDIGKLRRPEFFKENQADGFNPHDDLTPELSANIIKSHAIDGYNLINKNRLPQEIANVCVEHHGTLPILYFYDKARKFTDGDVDLQQYCYPGPKPTTKIAAIIMIADGCEAAARSLQDRSRDNVKKVVRKIVNDRLALGQFDDCEITLKELNIIIHTVVNNLTGIYHSRIEYPKVNLDGVEL
jgi:putative nucleotidyltransferase with HDIG domain